MSPAEQAALAPVEGLVADWRRADARYGRLERWSPLVRLVLWPCAFALTVAMVGGLAGPLLWVPVAGLIAALAHDTLLDRADDAVADAWTELYDHTGLTGDELVALIVDGDETEVAR